MDAAATTIVVETGETILVCGSSCYSSAVVDAETTEWAKAVEMTAACGSSCCSSSVADAETDGVVATE